MNIKRHKQYNHGFTLVELMITLLISMIVVGSIYTAFISQQHTYIVQDQVAEMQQNIRAALMMITREIRMAGYDPTGDANAGITVATNSQFGFTQDIDEDGNVTSSETITFKLNGDADGDGVVDGGGVSTMGRRTGAGVYQPIAENIQAIEFYYTLVDGIQTTSPSNLNDIRSVQISILARAGQPDRKFINSMTYNSASGGVMWAPTPGVDDHYRRRLLITTVNCRNMGL